MKLLEWLKAHKWAVALSLALTLSVSVGVLVRVHVSSVNQGTIAINVGGSQTIAPQHDSQQVQEEPPRGAPSRPPQRPIPDARGLATGVIDTGHYKVPINVWLHPGTDSNGPVGALANGTVIRIVCQVHGQPIRHGGRITDLWDAFEEEDGRRYQGRRYVFDGLVKTGSDGFVAPLCDDPAAPLGMD